MTFSLVDAAQYLCCPATNSPLSLTGGALVSAEGRRYPVIDDIVDLTVQDGSHEAASDYDPIAGLRYNLFLFNPFTMAFTWGPGVLSTPLRVRPAKEFGAGVFLDVPCGTGIFTARAYRSATHASILAVDYSMGMLKAARRRAKRLGADNVVFLRADVARLPIRSSAIDGCLSMAGLHAFPDPSAAAREIGRVLKPGSQMTATVACSGERRISDMMIERVMKPMGYFNQGLPVRTYRNFFERAGFARVDASMAGAVAILRATRGSASS